MPSAGRPFAHALALVGGLAAAAARSMISSVEGQLADAAPGGAAGGSRDVTEQHAAGGILLRLGSSRYTVDMADVAEVIALPPVTRIPGAPGWLSGVANWRGRMLPGVDVRPLLGAETTPLASRAPPLAGHVGGIPA